MSESLAERSMRFAAGLMMVAGICVFLFVIIYVPGNPLLDMHGDKAEPAVVRRGEVVHVTRNFRIDRDVFVTIIRRLATGDCKVSCTYVDLPTSHSTFPRDQYNLVRGYTVPHDLIPGIWRLEFFIVIENFVGHQASYPLKVLEIEVTE